MSKAYYRQVDDAYNQEAEEVAELMKQIQEKAENKMAGDSGKKPKDKTDPKDGKAGKSRSVSPGDKFSSKGPPVLPNRKRATHRWGKGSFLCATQVLMEEFEGRITDSSRPVTSMAIPFASLQAHGFRTRT